MRGKTYPSFLVCKKSEIDNLTDLNGLSLKYYSSVSPNVVLYKNNIVDNKLVEGDSLGERRKHVNEPLAKLKYMVRDLSEALAYKAYIFVDYYGKFFSFSSSEYYAIKSKKITKLKPNDNGTEFKLNNQVYTYSRILNENEVYYANFAVRGHNVLLYSVTKDSPVNKKGVYL